MNKSITLLGLTLGLLTAPLGHTLSADTLLNTDATVRANGSYLYFSAASVPFLSQAYYPGGGANNAPGLRKPDGSHAAGAIDSADAANAWIGFNQGYLTDNNVNTAVNGWGGFTLWQTGGVNRGPYVLFDLGAEYDLTKIEVLMSRTTAQAWNTAENVQQVWTATSLSAIPGTGVALSNSTEYWTQREAFTFDYSTGTHTGTYTIALSGAPVRYVLLQLFAGGVDSYNPGGIINDVNFYAIPESSTVTLLLGAVALGVCIGYRRFRR